ncbi:TPA: DUF3164 family protein [Klebsiella pneumoniae]|uniref:DUF3164 family protein n=1 Tax=Klebsiella/Raoultella group TaxID=2890311 RepID=UPI000B4063C9|nr:MULTISPECIES: DUF3164 family protein [Klebsiella/Raoultella group]HDS9253947.1 DUF3164 family protein [Klebsiella pneumoniae subsp. pneumoniae]HDU4943201.1 DUF3164 family protein [Klebsiella pneumoniae subsp. ozaenae]HDX8710644.1 DUF3164 family protein [Klebsiella michiganensis]ELI6779823.1 DUF3164 family protein [Klebsiella pneumoniae]KAB1784509.1 DUF3164 family protein [Klebsiella pneumoniae]
MNNLQKQFTEKNAPEGYWVDAKDAFIPVKMLKPIDLVRDTLVGEIVTKAIELNKLMKEFKESSFGDIGAFVDLSANEYGVKLGGKKGNVTLYSFDGRYLIQRAMADRIAFDERLQAAKELIDQCLADWTEGARPELQILINRAFSTDKSGAVSTGAVLALRRYEIDDQRWHRAMEAIGESLQVIATSSYIRIYERIGDTDQYMPIALNMATV